MSTSRLTPSERLALRKWAHDHDITPNLPKAIDWLREAFGKDVSEQLVQPILARVSLETGVLAALDGEISPLARPGFGADLKDMPEVEHRFPTGLLDDWEAVTLTFREICMLWFVEQITNKPEWNVKVFNRRIVAKWKAEVMAVDWPSVGIQHGDFSDDMFKWCLSELREKAELFESTGIVPIFDASAAVVKSDTAIPDELKEELKKAVTALENVPEHEKDWHPGSDGKVLDLVHPSLWPLIYGRTRVVANKRVTLEDSMSACGVGDIVPAIIHDEKDNEMPHSHPRSDEFRMWSPNFQWLPCEVELDEDKSTIVSYINNLHPTHHSKLYPIIQQFIQKALPLWDVVYRWPEEFETQRIFCKNVGRECKAPKICKTGGRYHGCYQTSRPQEPGEEPRPDMYGYNSGGDDDITKRDRDWFARTHPIKQPNPAGYRPVNLKSSDVKTSGFLNNTERIQVIVKLANIHLTPENPEYSGGSWHIEGQLNEHICATALYYYDCDNITDSHLAFRTSANREDLMMELGYEQDDHYSIQRTFAIDSRSSTLQELGRVLTREGRLLAFPNVYQHRVAPFELADKTKPGHRKILALFLVDPEIPVLSTANVPPQQREWWIEAVTPNDRMGPLPPELTEMIFDSMDFPIGLEEAKKIRLDLMDERSLINEDVDSQLERQEWNFCEH